MDTSKYDPWVFKSLDSGNLNQYLKGMKVLHLDDSLDEMMSNLFL